MTDTLTDKGQVLVVAIGLYNYSSTNVLRNLNVFFIFTQLWYIFMNRPSKLREMLDKFVFWIVTEFQGVVYASAVSPVSSLSTHQCLDLAQLALNWRRSRAMASTLSLKRESILSKMAKHDIKILIKECISVSLHTYTILTPVFCIRWRSSTGQCMEQLLFVELKTDFIFRLYHIFVLY